MSKGIEMLHGEVGASFVIHHDGADRASAQFPADHDGGNIAFFEIGEEFDVNEQPVGNDDKAFDWTS